MKVPSTPLETETLKGSSRRESKEKTGDGTILTEEPLKTCQEEINIWDELGDLAVGATESVAAHSSPYDINAQEDDENIDPHDIPLQSEAYVTNENSNGLMEMNEIEEAQIELLVKDEEKSAIDKLVGNSPQVEDIDREEGEVSDEMFSGREPLTSEGADVKESKDPDPKSVEEYYNRLEKIYAEAKRMTRELQEGFSELFKGQRSKDSKKREGAEINKQGATREHISDKKRPSENQGSRSRIRNRSSDRRSRTRSRSRRNRERDIKSRSNISRNNISNNREGHTNRNAIRNRSDTRTVASKRTQDFSRRGKRSRSCSISYCTDCEREKRHSIERTRKTQRSPKRNTPRSPRPHPLLRPDDKNDPKSTRPSSNKRVDTKEKQRAKTLVTRQMKIISDVIDNPKPKQNLSSNQVLDLGKNTVIVDVNRFTTKKPKPDKPSLKGLKTLDDMENFITLLKDKNKEAIMADKDISSKLMQLKKKGIESENISPLTIEKTRISIRSTTPDTSQRKLTKHGVRKSLYFQTTKPKPQIRVETNSVSSIHDSSEEGTKRRNYKTDPLPLETSDNVKKSVKESEEIVKIETKAKSLSKERQAKDDANQKVREWIKGQCRAEGSASTKAVKESQTHIRKRRKRSLSTTNASDSESKDEVEMLEEKPTRHRRNYLSTSVTGKNLRSKKKILQQRSKSKPKKVLLVGKDLKQLVLSKELRNMLKPEMLKDGMLLKVKPRGAEQNAQPQLLKVVRVIKKPSPKKPIAPQKTKCTLKDMEAFMEQLRQKRDSKRMTVPDDKIEVLEYTPRESRFLDRKRAKRKAKLMACLAVENKISNKEARLLEAMRKAKSKQQLEAEEVLKKFKAENEAVMMPLLKGTEDKSLPKDKKIAKDLTSDTNNKETELSESNQTTSPLEAEAQEALAKELLASTKAQNLLNSLRARKKRQKS